jgi:hypothetical protein
MNTPLASVEALTLLKKGGVRSEVLNELINCDAVRVTGAVMEVQHEAMADYLRARQFVTQKNLKVEQLDSLPVTQDSLFPVLLMALLPTYRLQSAWWRRLSSVSIRVYGEALRYSFDVSSELNKLEPEKLSQAYLEDILNGIETPLQGVFRHLHHAVAEHLIGDGDGELAVTGIVHTSRSEISFMLHTRGSDNAPRVRVAFPEGPGIRRYVNLNLSNLRLDSGRLIGSGLLSNTVLKLVKHQCLRGGPTWAAERLIGRVRYLVETSGTPIALNASLDDVETMLRHQHDRPIGPILFEDGESFSIQSLLDDIELLRAASAPTLDPWWRRLGWDEAASSQTDEVIIRVLNEHYRRVQRAYAEIIDATFPEMKNEMTMYTALPLRWDTTVVRRVPSMGGETIHYKILPVASWEQAGADVRFSDCAPDFSRFEEETRDALATVGRSASTFYGQSGFTRLPDFRGRRWSGHFDGATSVVHEVCPILKDELTSLFSAIPYRDGLL